MAKQAWVATVQLCVVDCPNEAAACDAISSLLSELPKGNCIIDWQYLRLGGQFLYPTSKLLDDAEYGEGDAFA